MNSWYMKGNKGSPKEKNVEGAKFSHENLDYSETMVLMAAFPDQHVDSKIWFLDTGYSNHMTGRRVWLADFDESKKSNARFVDNSSLQAEGEETQLFKGEMEQNP